MSEKALEKDNELMQKIESLCKRRGFIFQGSELYGGLAGTWDYGPLGVALKKNIERLWWHRFVESREDMFGLESAILMNPRVWEASGHVAGFSDPLVECRNCHSKYRSDHLIDDIKARDAIKNKIIKQLTEAYEQVTKDYTEANKQLEVAIELRANVLDTDKNKAETAIAYIIEQAEKISKKAEENFEFAKWLNEQLKKRVGSGLIDYFYLNKYVNCPNCKDLKWEFPQEFNMMFSTSIGAVEETSMTVYLRPENAQGMFVNYKNILDSLHPKLPFGIAQIGKAFRNEITPRDFTFRTREFNLMEFEYFVKPSEWERHFEYWKYQMQEWIEQVGIDPFRVHQLEVAPEDRAHYSKRTTDFEFDFPFGRKELYGLACRGDFDLKQHEEYSSVDLKYLDEEAATDSPDRKFLPYCVEPSFGLDRTILAVLTSAYREDTSKPEEVRSYLALKPAVAPVVCAVSPLLKNKPELVAMARRVYDILKTEFGRVMWDDNGNIGKRYRRQDEIGTPWCIVIDFDSLEHDDVTVRDRDTGSQERVKIGDLVSKIKEQL